MTLARGTSAVIRELEDPTARAAMLLASDMTLTDSWEDVFNFTFVMNESSRTAVLDLSLFWGNDSIEWRVLKNNDERVRQEYPGAEAPSTPENHVRTSLVLGNGNIANKTVYCIVQARLGDQDVTPAPVPLALDQDSLSLMAEAAATSVVLAEATGGTAPYTYSVSSLPTGVTFTPATRTLSIAANISGSTSFFYYAVDSAGNSVSESVNLSYDTRSTLTLANQSDSLTAFTNSGYISLVEAAGGTGPYTYTLETSHVITGASPTAIVEFQYPFAGHNVRFNVTGAHHGSVLTINGTLTATDSGGSQVQAQIQLEITFDFS